MPSVGVFQNPLKEFHQKALFIYPELLKFYAVCIDSETGEIKKGRAIKSSYYDRNLASDVSCWSAYSKEGVRCEYFDAYDFESKVVLVYDSDFSVSKEEALALTYEYGGQIIAAIGMLGGSSIMAGLGGDLSSVSWMFQMGNDLNAPIEAGKISKRIGQYSPEFRDWFNGIGASTEDSSKVYYTGKIQKNLLSDDIVSGKLINTYTEELRIKAQLTYMNDEMDITEEETLFYLLKPGEYFDYTFTLPKTGVNIFDHRSIDDYRIDFVTSTLIDSRIKRWPLYLSPTSSHSAGVGSPVNLHAEDQYGRHVGVNSTGGVEIEIPGAYYSGPNSHPQEIKIYDPLLDVRFYLEGTDEGNFTLKIERNNGSQAEIVQYNNVSVTNHTKAIVNDFYTGIDPTLYIDSNGDNFFEAEIAPDSLNTEEAVPPFLDNISYPTHIEPNECIDINVSIGDESMVGNSSILMFYPSGYSEVLLMSFISMSAEGEYNISRFTYSFSNTSEIGSYEFYMVCEDIYGNSRGFGAYSFENNPYVFDTYSSANPYPSISGTHNGTITPFYDIVNVTTLYTYPCSGTGGHTEYARIYNVSGTIAEAYWNGYTGDWHNLSFNTTFTLYANETYNYTIRTGSYPQIIHAESKDVTGGTITCTSFEDANGKVHTDWIPAIKLWSD